MKIAYDYQIFTLQAYGGISRYFHTLCKKLAIKGEDVRIFAPYHCNQLIKGLNSEAVVGKAIASKDFSKPQTLALLLTNQLLAYRAIQKWKPSLVHETYFAYRRSAPARYPVVITVHDMIHEKFPHYFNALDPTSYLKRRAIQRADQIICISESTQRDLVELFPAAEAKITVVHLGFSSFQSDSPGIKAPQDFLLYVGSRGGHKNFKTLLRAYALSKKINSNMSLIAFGGGPFTKEEKRLIHELRLSPSQVSQTSGDDSVLADYYRKALAFVYPSYYEGFGLPPLEAMAQQCPVISSHTSSMPEVIGDAAEFFDPKSVDALVSAIEQVILSPSRRRELIARGNARLEKFSWTKCAERTHQVYKALVP